MNKTKIQMYANYLEKWLLKKIKDSKTNGIVFGLSGGIDSAVIAGIAKTILPHNHLAVIMHIDNSELDKKCTNKIIKDFNLRNKELDLTSNVKSLAKILNISPLNDLNVFGNLKARLRTISLYALAQKNNYLVCGTSNYDEWITGYFTKYGDAACDIALLRNCLKKDVYELAKYYQVPKIIIQRKPTASLYKNQTDEADLGLSYEELDNYLLGLEKLSIEKQKHLENLMTFSEHKRKLPFVPKKYSKLK